MACRPQDNPRSASSDEVPPELVVLGLREASLRPTGLTGRRRASSGFDVLELVCWPIPRQHYIALSMKLTWFFLHETEVCQRDTHQ